MKSKWVLFLCYALLTSVLVVCHEPWRDEVDAWLMARDASLSEILAISPNAGTPVLWYFILKPFTWLGFGFGTLPVLNLLMVWGAALVLIFQSPFSLLVLISLCFSWYLSFEYSVVARNYGVGLLGLCLLLGSWSGQESSRLKRRTQAGISWILLSFSSVHFLSFVPPLMALDFLRRRNDSGKFPRLTDYLWPASLFCLSVFILWPTSQGQMSNSFVERVNVLNSYVANSMGLFPSLSHWGVAPALAVLILIWAWFGIELRTSYRLGLAAMFVAVNSIFVFKYFYPAHRYGGFNWMIFMAAAWLALLPEAASGKSPSPRVKTRVSVLFFLLFVINAPGTTKGWWKEITLPFSDAGKTAEFLVAQNLLDTPIACISPAACSSILGYLPKKMKLWYPGINDWGTHMKWDATYRLNETIEPAEALARARAYFARQTGVSRFLFISSKKVADPKALGLEALFKDSATAWGHPDEAFEVYSVANRLVP